MDDGQIGANEYRCSICRGVFEKGWSDEEAGDELLTTFPGFDVSDCGLVCDDCWNEHFAKASAPNPMQEKRG